ncbi:MAG: phosphoenolpyruvate--protein phosphotransferase, partial [Chthoniobacterales bacterium]|nr:phosphoenolpyruvate--protein phosphotransferase [Chthoniobacterales bacterium]
LNRKHPPDEEEQFKNYARVAERCKPHSVIIRTLDIGGDKSTESLDLPKEQNPFLGCRAIRYCLEHPEIFKPQIRAILRAGVYGNVRMMLPMISGVEELRAAKKIIEECKRELSAEGASFQPEMELGTMIELPSAALSAEWLAKEVSFFSIGTNDLIQYAIAVDRVNERIAHLYQPAHPAILRLIHITTEAAHDAGIWCGVCGEMAGDICLIPLLVGLGVDELSTAPSLVPRVKKAICSLSFVECQALALEAMSLSDHASVFSLSESHAQQRYSELF